MLAAYLFMKFVDWMWPENHATKDELPTMNAHYYDSDGGVYRLSDGGSAETEDTSESDDKQDTSTNDEQESGCDDEDCYCEECLSREEEFVPQSTKSEPVHENLPDELVYVTSEIDILISSGSTVPPKLTRRRVELISKINQQT